MFKLEVLNTAFKGKRFAFRDGLTVGSGPTCTIRAQHPELEPVHVRFVTGPNGQALVEVAAEKAHLFVNGKDVLRSELRHHDELVVGPLRFKVIDGARQSSTTLRLDELVDKLESTKGEDVYDFAREDLFYLVTKDPTLREAISFSIPSKDRFIEQAQVFLARLVKQTSMVELQVEAFMTCAKELILNAHRHGHQFDETKTIVIRYRDLGARVALTVEDQGKGFDHAGVLDGVRNKNAAQAARDRYKAGGVGGLGFQLITKLVTDLRYNEPGNRVTFTVPKEMPPKPGAAPANAAKKPSGPAPAVKPSGPAVAVKPATPAPKPAAPAPSAATKPAAPAPAATMPSGPITPAPMPAATVAKPPVAAAPPPASVAPIVVPVGPITPEPMPAVNVVRPPTPPSAVVIGQPPTPPPAAKPNGAPTPIVPKILLPESLLTGDDDGDDEPESAPNEPPSSGAG